MESFPETVEIDGVDYRIDSDFRTSIRFEVFIQDAESGLVSDPQKTEELFKRTPGYASWQGEYWLA